ncbi:MAG: PQQ-binding-like beta-propeller repeat protein [Acidobacteriota bacterium]|nr:PQQ-binding-like beta-propeller repeat protein [Acidobacteriota bacterium]
MLLLAWLSLYLVIDATPCVLAQTWASALSSSAQDDSADAVMATSGGRWILAGAANQDGNRDDALLVAVDAQGDVIWSAAYGGSSREVLRDLIALDGGQVMAIGSTRSFGMGYADALIMVVNARGKVVWARAYGMDQEEALVAMGMAGKDAIVVGGNSNDFSRTDFLVLKIDRLGRLLWHRTYGIAEEFESLEDLAVMPDGGFLLVGSTSFGEDSRDHGLAVRVDASGAIVWQRTFRMQGADVFRAVVVLDDGGCLIAGQAHTIHSILPRGWLLRLDSQGEIVWHQELPFDSLEGGSFYDLILTPEGTALASGDYTPYGEQASEGWLLAFDPSDGSVFWQRSYGDFELERLYGSVCLADRGCLFAGLTRSYSRGQLYSLNDTLILRTDDNASVSPACTIGGVPNAIAEQQPVTVESYAGVEGELLDLTVTMIGMQAVQVETSRDEICTGATLFPPTEVSPAESLTPLLFTDATHLEWEAAAPSASDSFDLYRGDVADLGLGGAGVCLATGLTAPAATDEEQPAPAQAWFYLVGGVNAAGWGPLGVASDGSERQAATYCP